MGSIFDQYIDIPGKNRALGALVFLALLGAGYYWFYFQGLERSHKILQNRQSFAATEYKDKYSQASNVKNINKYVSNLNDELEKAVTLLPESGDISRLLKDVSILAGKNSIQISAFGPEVEVIREFYVEVPIQIELSGTFQDLAVFVHEITHMPRILNVDSISLERKDSSKQKNKISLNATIKAKTYHSGIDAAKVRLAKTTTEERKN